MNRPAHRAAATVLGVFLLASVSPASAGVPTDQLKGSIEQVIKVLDDPASKADPEKRRTAVRQAAQQIFDFSEAAKRSLGRHWQGLSDKDRQEFTGLFTDLLERAYIGKIEQYSGERITYSGDSVAGDIATVKTKFTTKKGTEIPVDYRMMQKGDRWLVYDVSVEGLSLIANYRGQFNKIIETSSYAELVNRMKAKSDEFHAPATSAKKES